MSPGPAPWRKRWRRPSGTFAWCTRGSEAGIVTVSIGFESFEPAHKHDVAGELVQRADIALYAAKRDGRNGVRWYGEIQPYADALAG